MVVVAFRAIQQPFGFDRVIHLLSQVIFHSCIFYQPETQYPIFFSPALSTAVCGNSCTFNCLLI